MSLTGSLVLKIICFVGKGNLPGFIVSVDEVERLTGFNFNSMLDDTVEDYIEDDVEEMW